jgi:hypothetical protein
MVTVLGLDISKLSATYWLLSEIPDDPKSLSRRKSEQKLIVSPEGRDKLLSLNFDFAVLEPTGIYSRIWRHWLREAGREYRLVGHQELAAYRGGWKLQKTDKLDGLAMTLYGIERHARSSSWLIEKDNTLSDLVLFCSHLNQQKNGYQNNLRQKLAYQLPEWYDKKIIRGWGSTSAPGLLKAIAGDPSAKWEKEIEASCGIGLGREAASLAKILLAVEAEEINCEQWIEAELAKAQYAQYLEATEKLGLSPWLRACLIAAIYPFEQFLDDGKRRVIHTLTKVNQKRVRKDQSLRSFKLSCGMGLIWMQSGDFAGWVPGGSGATRKNLRSSIQSSYLRYKKDLKQGVEKDSRHLELIKHKFDNQGMMKVSRHWIEDFYSELVSLFDA